MRRLNEWKAQDGSTIKLSSGSPTGSGTQQKFEDFTDLYLQLIEKIKKLWGCSVIRCESDILELKLAAGVFRRHLLIDYNSNQKTFTVTITDPTTRKQIESGTCYRGFISVLLLLMKNGIIKDAKLEESTDFAAEFKLYENLFDPEPVKVLKENFRVYCSDCKKTVSVDHTFMCPSCSSKSLLDDYIEAEILEPTSKYKLIYNENGIIGKSDSEKPVNPLGKTAIAHVTEEFFNSIKPVTRHKITSKNSNSGGFRLEDVDKATAKLVKRALELSAINY